MCYIVTTLFMCLVLATLDSSEGLRYNYGDGSYYIGSVDEFGKPDGIGQYYNSAGDLEYQGGYRDGVPNGNGTWFGPNGERLDADFVDGHAVAQGIMELKNGDMVLGLFHNHHPHGQVRIARKNGEEIVGDFRNGILHGEISWKSITGNTMSGTYRMGRPHGNVVVVDEDGNVIYSGKFMNGQPLSQDDLPEEFQLDQIPMRV